MDIRYKSFVPRSKQDHHFDQLLQASSSVNKPSYEFTFNKSIPKKDYSTFTPKSPPQSSQNRKKVNVVTFTPDESNELVSHVIVPTNNDSPTNETYKSSFNTNLPSILRTSRTLSINDNQSETNIILVDSASKLIAAKRKVAKEVNETRVNEESKKKYSPPVLENSTKRAVSPEILRPEPLEQEMYNTIEKQKWHHESFLNAHSDNEDIISLYQTQNCSTVQYQSNIYKRSTYIPLSSTDKNQPVAYTDVNKKSRSIINSKKAKVLYNPRPWQEVLDEDDGDYQYRLQSENIVYRSNSDSIKYSGEAPLYNFDNDDEVNSSSNRSIIKSRSDCSHNQQSRFSINCDKPSKKSAGNRQRYSLLENVKEAHECQETGETQDLLDDVEYLIEGLKNSLTPSTRTLSIITLTGKCMTKSFRDLMKAHGLLTKVFKYLDDAFLNESVAMCTAALFLVFSRDKQPRIFDDNSLALLLKLPRISKNQSKPGKENERVRDKIRLMLNRFHHPHDDNKGTDSFDSRVLQSLSNISSSFQRPCSCCRHLKLDNNITTEDLVVECLLQFSSHKCPDWFKSLLRKQHGLDLLCDQVTASVEYLGADLGPQCLDEFVMDRLYRLFNYMRFFEHMTFQNRDNQSYLVDYCEATLIETLLRCLKLCAANLSYQPNGSQEKKLIQACLLANLRLLANISHDNEYTSNLLGSCPGLLKLIFSCLLHLPRFMGTGKRFDLSVLALALLINLVEHCSENRRRMAHVSVSRKRVACLGKCGQIVNSNEVKDNSVVNTSSSKSMEFSFDDEAEDEDMDVDDDEDEDPNEYINVDCESSDTKINILEALVKLFLRHDDRAKNNTLIEGEEETATEINEEGDSNVIRGDNDPKWRLVADRGLSRKNKTKKLRVNTGREGVMDDLTDSEDDCSSDEGADVEFMISSKEEEEELQKKLSAAGQHMQDSVVSAYAALLLGCIIKSSHHYMERIRQHLPLGKFKILAFVLAKFLSILSLTSGMGHTGEESILEIVRLLEAQDQGTQRQIVNENDPEDPDMMTSRPLCRNNSRTHSSQSPTSSPNVRYDHLSYEENEEEEQDSSSILSS